MSELMFYEAHNADGTQYKMGDWKKYAIHNDKAIAGFFGDYRYLSNFELCDVWYEGLKYPSTENAYQAAKVIPELRESFVTMSPSDSKKAWKEVPKEGLLPNWDARRVPVMASVTFDKFLNNTSLRAKLMLTHGKYLEERNHWRDNFWGFCIHKNEGKNALGRLLMRTRDYLR